MKAKISQQHLQQIGKAQTFIRDNLDKELSLIKIAKASGASRFHFIRVFSAFLGETPFEYIQRQKIVKALYLLQESSKSITDISYEVGFASQTSFNKAFKKLTGLNPSEFRNQGKENQKEILYALSLNLKQKELQMKLNLSEKPEIVERKGLTVFTLEESGGAFSEIAPVVWEKFLGILQESCQDLSQSEFLGISHVEAKGLTGKQIYKAAITAPEGKELTFTKLKQEKLKPGKYLKFLLKGSYLGLWAAFDKVFRFANENSYELADGPCLENYLNDPTVTPEDELLTEILVPIK